MRGAPLGEARSVRRKAVVNHRLRRRAARSGRADAASLPLRAAASAGADPAACGAPTPRGPARSLIPALQGTLRPRGHASPAAEPAVREQGPHQLPRPGASTRRGSPLWELISGVTVPGHRASRLSCVFASLREGVSGKGLHLSQWTR